MAELPPTLVTPRSVFARRRPRRSREVPDNVSLSSCWASMQQEAPAEMRVSRPIAQETLSSCSPITNSPQHTDNENVSQSDNCNSKNSKNSICDAPDNLERETTADSEVYVQSLTVSSAAETTQQAQAAAATIAAAAATAAATVAAAAAAAGQHMRRLLLEAKRVLFPSQLHGWLLVLLLLQQVLLIGLLLQQQQLVGQREAVEQHAVSMQLAYKEQQRRLLNSRRSRLGYKSQQQQQEPQQKQYCSCKACARLSPSEELIDIRDRFKHTYKDIEMHIEEMLTSLDTAAAAVEETYKETMNLPWKKRLDSKLHAMQEQNSL